MANETQSTEVVTIGCKLPNGLHLDVGDSRVTIKGTNSTEIMGGHGVTFGVPKAHWEQWKKEHAQAPFVRQGLVFAHGKAENVKAEAEEKKGNRSGLEGLDQNKLPANIERAPENDKRN